MNMMPYMPFPPYFGSKAGCILITLFGNSLRFVPEISRENPPKQLNPDLNFNKFKQSPVLEKAILLKQIAATFKFFAALQNLCFGIVAKY